jgi:UDP-GlcNAc3NAcA epimerase
MKIVTIIGARPQFIKAAIVSHRVREQVGVEEVLVHTGQHYDANMSEVFFDELEIAPPDHSLGISGGSHATQTARMLEGLEPVLLAEAPKQVLVYGDTNSTLAGALTAAKLNIPVVHVEAGMRSFNRAMPEEINRVLTDHLSSYLFTPTVTADANLAHEGIPANRIHLVGDVMYDASLHYGEKAGRSSDILARHSVDSGTFILATIHRAENTDSRERLTAIADALSELARDRPVLMPLHPRTAARLASFGLEDRLTGVQRIPPAGYLDMQVLERNAVVIVTDSGGVQKEAFFHRVPCITVRAETEWVELVELGWNHLASPESTNAIVSEVTKAFERPSTDLPDDIYGGGAAAKRIAKYLGQIAASTV